MGRSLPGVTGGADATVDHVPAVGDGSGRGTVVRLARRPPPGAPPSQCRIVWAHEAGTAATANAIIGWMRAKPEQWDYWGWLAGSFGGTVLDALVAETAVRAAETQVQRVAEEAARVLADGEKRRRRAQQIDIYLHDARGKRPGLSLQSADQPKPFWKISFAEKWERDRVYDWVRWQRRQFIEWRELVAREGTVALERLVMAGMMATERDVKERRLAFTGRRPLRFWTGE